MKHLLRKCLFSVLILSFLLSSFSIIAEEKIDRALLKKAMKIHDSTIVIDTHCDAPMYMVNSGVDIGKRSDKVQVDLVKMKEGGLDGVFLVVFVSNGEDENHPARIALKIIDEIHSQVERNSGLAEFAASTSDIRRIAATGKRVILMAMENGGPIEDSLALLRDYYRLGVRYVTLTHVKANRICDSSSDRPRWNGLSPFGKEVVAEMNRLGMMIDVSHISDDAFLGVISYSKAPVIASHSSVRAICDVDRNMSDEMIKVLAKNGGVIQINFYSGFLDSEFAEKSKSAREKLKSKFDKLKEKYGSTTRYYKEAMDLFNKYRPSPPSIEVLINHIDHAVKLVGADHVGLGSDFDGAGSFPQGLEDSSKYYMITYHLLKRGYSEEDIKKILGGNLIRVFEKVEKVAAKLRSEK